MSRHTPAPVREWLDAEADQRLEDADQAFRTLADGWAPVAPPPFLAARVARALAAAGPQPTGLGWWSRAGIAAVLCACGAALGVLPAQAAGGLLLTGVEGVATVVGRFLVGMSLAWDAAELFYRPLAWLGYAMRAMLSDPLPVSLLIVNVVLAAGGFAALRRVLSVREV